MANRSTFLLSIIFWTLLGISGPLSSAFANEDVIPGSRYTSARAAAMGDSFLPLADDAATGLFYNPAGLAKIRRAMIEPLNISGYGDSSFLSHISSASQSYNLGSYASTLKQSPGTWMGAGGSLVSTYGFAGFSFGFLLQSEYGGQANVDGTFNSKSTTQFIPAVGKAVQFFDGVLRIGYSLQWVNEAIDSTTAQAATAPSYSAGASQGSGLSSTVGVGIVVPLSLLPSFNVVLRNVGGTHYSSYVLYQFVQNSGTTPATELMTEDASFSIHPRLAHGIIDNLVFTGHDLSNQSGVTPLSHLSIGNEIDFGGQFFLRAGVSGVSPSGGFGLKRKGAEMSLTYYTVNIGTSTEAQMDSRVMLQYQFRNF